MKTVILAEKPDQAGKYAKALGDAKRSKGYFNVKTTILEGDVVVTWGVGHLVGLSSMDKYDEKYKKWSMENLPFLPEKMLYEVNSNTKDQFKAAKGQLEEADLIIIATDPDREGENIAYSIFSKCSAKVRKTPMKRLWINSMGEKEIRRGFQNLRDSKETYNYFIEAQTRQMSDYLVGMNFTQFFTLKAQAQNLRGTYSAGRVQTPCVSLVVENHLAIENFKEEKFYKAFGEVHKDGKVIKFQNDTKYASKDELLLLLERYQLHQPTELKISSVKVENKSKKAPKLFNLGGIQSYANKKWKYSLDKSLKIIQSLYQDGFLSYPRTDCDYITHLEFEYLKENLEQYKEVLGVNFNNGNLDPRDAYVNDKKVLEHYAIIPTDDIPDLSKLSEDQKNIYLAVVRNTILMFADDYEYETTTAKIQVEELEFIAKGRVPKKAGWTNIETLEESEDEEKDTLPALSEGESVVVTFKTEEGKTKPPARLTESSLGGKGGLMDKLGLGTAATRSSILKTIEDREYVKKIKTKLYPTEKGLLLYEFTKDILLGSPEMTASWEAYLQKIGQGKGTQSTFMANINKFITNTLNDLKSKSVSSALAEQVMNSNKSEFGDYIVEEQKKVYKCSHKKHPDSNLIIFKNMSNKKISIANVKKLLEKGKTPLIKGFANKQGKKFDAYLVLRGNEVKFEFENKKK